MLPRLEKSEKEFTGDLFGVEIEFRAEFNYTPGDPGVCSGPPENCYPPEPAEIEILNLYIVNAYPDPKTGNVSEDVTYLLGNMDLCESIESILFEMSENN